MKNWSCLERKLHQFSPTSNGGRSDVVEVTLPQKRSPPRGLTPLAIGKRLWTEDARIITARSSKTVPDSSQMLPTTARSLECLAYLYLITGKRRKGCQLLKASIEKHRGQANPEKLGDLLMTLGLACSTEWDINDQIDPLYAAGSLFKNLGLHSKFTQASCALADAFSVRKCPRHAYALVEEAYRAAKLTESPLEVAVALDMLAAVCEPTLMKNLKESADVWEALNLRQYQMRSLFRLATQYIQGKTAKLALPVCIKIAKLIQQFNLKPSYQPLEQGQATYKEADFFFPKLSGPGLFVSLQIAISPHCALGQRLYLLLNCLRCNRLFEEALMLSNYQKNRNFTHCAFLLAQAELFEELHDYPSAIRSCLAVESCGERKCRFRKRKALVCCKNVCLSAGNYLEAIECIKLYLLHRYVPPKLNFKKEIRALLLEMAIAYDVLGRYDDAKILCSIQRRVSSTRRYFTVYVRLRNFFQTNRSALLHRLSCIANPNSGSSAAN